MAVNRLSVVAFQETRHRFTARCLEYDIMAVGRTSELAIDALLRMVQAHIDFDGRHARPALSAFVQAPRLYWEAFKRDPQRRVFDMPSQGVGRRDRPIQVDVAIVPHHPAIRSLAARIA
jgi:hypothetical protein